ncbi:MAG: LmeA family phospholipid-binding protein [Armatimonadetes bacterium]|nr:LmeA family phospholipid-binding protein [Armatimonadota bacterium]
MTLWLLLAGLGILGAHAGQEIRRFERCAAAEIAARLEGDEKQVTVKVKLNGIVRGLGGSLNAAEIVARRFSVDSLPLFTEPERTTRGEIKELRLRLYDFTLRGLHFEELRADIADCRYDLGLARREKQFRLSRSGVGPGYARINEAALEQFILRKYAEIKSVSVRLTKHKVFVEGRGEFLLFKADFYVIATLEPRNGVELRLENAVVFLDGHRVRDGSERALLEALNPVIDLDRDLGLHGAIKVSEVKIGEGVLEVLGEATIPPLPKAGPRTGEAVAAGRG